MIVGDGYLGIGIFDISDKSNPLEVVRWYENSGGTVEKVTMDKKEKYIFGSIRNYGVVVLEITSFTQPLTKISEYKSGDSE